MKLTRDMIEEIEDALEDRYNFCKSMITEDEGFMIHGKPSNEDIEVCLNEMNMIQEIYQVIDKAMKRKQ